MTDNDRIELRIGLPLEISVAGTVLKAISLAYPHTTVGSVPDGAEIVLRIDPRDLEADQQGRLVEALRESIKDCAIWWDEFPNDYLCVDSGDIDLRVLAETLIEKLAYAEPFTTTEEVQREGVDE